MNRIFFTITGLNHRFGSDFIEPDMQVRLVKEPDNEFDSDAIAVYAEGEKVGYVANSAYTKSELTSSASELQDKIPDTADGCYLLYLDRYADVQFRIGRIIKK
jgi:hypothetical protein